MARDVTTDDQERAILMAAKTTKTVGKTLRPISSTFRRRVRQAYNGPNRLTDEHRRALESAIFEAQNDLEHRQHDHPQVAAMIAVRAILLDDTGDAESQPGSRYPQHDAAKAMMLERRRTMSPEMAAASAARFAKWQAENR